MHRFQRDTFFNLNPIKLTFSQNKNLTLLRRIYRIESAQYNSENVQDIFQNYSTYKETEKCDLFSRYNIINRDQPQADPEVGISKQLF